MQPKTKALAGLAVALVAATSALAPRMATASTATAAHHQLNPKDFVRVVNNPYFPLPVGRTIVYKGTKDGETRDSKMTVLNNTKKVIQGIHVTTVHDVTTHNGQLREDTFDWFAQDKSGTVWYLGEDTTAYAPDGTKDKSGSFEAGVGKAKAGVVMPAHPRIPDSWRQEFSPGVAEDTAFVVNRGETVTVPYGKVRNSLNTLEATRLEPDVVDRKVYGPGLGIIVETAVNDPTELLRLVKVTG